MTWESLYFQHDKKLRIISLAQNPITISWVLPQNADLYEHLFTSFIYKYYVSVMSDVNSATSGSSPPCLHRGTL